MVRSRFTIEDLFNDPLMTRGLSALGVLQNELEQFASRAFKPTAGPGDSFVPVNVTFEGDTVRVAVEVPGVAREDLDVTVQGRTLEIAGKRQPTISETEGRVLKRERWSGDFRRVVELPFEVDAEAVDAVCTKGILNISLSRQKVSPSKKIQVKSE